MSIWKSMPGLSAPTPSGNTVSEASPLSHGLEVAPSGGSGLTQDPLHRPQPGQPALTNVAQAGAGALPQLPPWLAEAIEVQKHPTASRSEPVPGGNRSGWGRRQRQLLSIDSDTYRESDGKNRTGPQAELSLGTTTWLAGSVAATIGNYLLGTSSHDKWLDQEQYKTLKAMLRRHESLFGEQFPGVRGICGAVAVANAAVPGAMREDATTEEKAQWYAAALTWLNVRLLLVESPESFYVAPGRPLSDVFDRIKKSMNVGGGLSALFPFSTVYSLPFLADKLDNALFMTSFYKAIGWGKDGKAPSGFNNRDGEIWFGSRFFEIAVITNALTYMLGRNKGPMTWDNFFGGLCDLLLTPSVGGAGITITQLIPIIGKINAIAHGDIGPAFTKKLSEYGIGRHLVYTVATALLTWPQYDLVISMMANTPNMKDGLSESGIVDCIEKTSMPCFAGPTELLYRVTDSTGAFLPVIVSSAFQLCLLAALCRKKELTIAPVSLHDTKQAERNDGMPTERDMLVEVAVLSATPEQDPDRRVQGDETEERTET